MARERDTDEDPPPPPPPSPWSSLRLPPKVEAELLRRLPSHADRVRFAAVCRRWRAAMCPQARQPLPWLALPDGAFFSFPSPASAAALRFPDAARYHGSCDDWLIFHGDGAGGGDGDGFLLANPFSGATARLPPLSRVRFIVGDGAAAAPALTWRGVMDDWRAPLGTTVRKLVMCQGGHAVVAAIVGDGRLGKIAVCRRDGTGSGSWVMSAHDAWRGFTDIAFYDGKVYAVEADTGDLFAMPTGVDTHTGEPTVAWARRVIKAAAAPAAARRRRAVAPPATRCYLCVSGGKLLMVRRAAAVTTSGGGAGAAEFAVFMADLASPRWSEVSSLGGDTALFVGRWCTLARRVSPYGLPGNRINFLDDGGAAFSRFGSYDMSDGAIYPLLPPLELRGADTPATWLFPREEQESACWCDLHPDVFGLVLERLSSRQDRVRLSEVCREWRASTRQHLLAW